MAFDPKNRPGSADHDVFALNREVEALDDRVTVVEAGGGGGGGLLKLTLRVTHNGGGGDVELTAASTTQTVNTSEILPAGALMLAFRERVDTLAVAGGLTALGVAYGSSLGPSNGGYFDHVVGDAGNNEASSVNTSSLSGFDYTGTTGQVDFTATGANLNTITAYDATFEFIYLDPAVTPAP
jgi:hypothetical protein